MDTKLEEDAGLITVDQLTRVMPKKVKGKITELLVDEINSLMGDQTLRENYRDNLLSYTGVMKDGNYKIQDYLSAVQYVSYKLLGSTNIEAYTKTFPDRYQRLVNNGSDSKTIASFSTAYGKTKLVYKIFEQTLIPSHILNADLYQKALNTQARLMTDANSEKVQTDAANSLLTHLKMPETQKIELNIGVKEDKTIEELRASTLALVAQQKAMLIAGAMSAQEVAHSKLLIVDSEEFE